MHSLSSKFIERLKNVDSALGAIYDSQDDAIYIHASRQGQQVYEMTVKRQFAENYEELENRTIQRLRECDVWQKYGTGKSYEQALWDEEERLRKENKKKVRDERIQMLKQDREMFKAAIWNAQHGRMDRTTALPYQTAKFSVDFSKKADKKNGFIVIDKRNRTETINTPQNELQAQGAGNDSL